METKNIENVNYQEKILESIYEIYRTKMGRRYKWIQHS